MVAAEKKEKIVEVVFTYTKEEYIRAARQHLLGGKAIRKYDPLLLALTAALSFSYLFYSSFSVMGIILVSVFTIATAFGGSLYFLQPVLGYRKNVKDGEEYTMIFRRDIIIWKTPSLESEVTWDAYRAMWQSKDFYFLIQSPRIYALIPRRAFTSAEQEHAFEKMARINIKNIKHLK